MTITGRTIARLAQPFEGGGGPSHSTIERIWMSGDAAEYLGEGNKTERVLSGLRNLRDGRRAGPGHPPLPPDHEKLGWVASELATMLVASGLVGEDSVAEVLRGGEEPEGTRPSSTSAAGSADSPHSEDARPSATPPGSRSRASQDVGQLVDDPRAVMVVHGQDSTAARAMFDWLRSVGLRPSEWNQLVNASGVASPFIGQVLESAFQRAQAVVVLFTPDEHVRLREKLASDIPTWRLQARPNVLFEAGMAFATHPERTVLVVLGDQEIPSDLAGRHYVRLGPAQALRDFAQRLEAAGCPVDLTGNDWLDVTRFPRRVVAPEPAE